MEDRLYKNMEIASLGEKEINKWRYREQNGRKTRTCEIVWVSFLASLVVSQVIGEGE